LAAAANHENDNHYVNPGQAQTVMIIIIIIVWQREVSDNNSHYLYAAKGLMIMIVTIKFANLCV
jgi:hypothetical protein